MQRASDIICAQNSLLLPLNFLEGHFLTFSSMKIIIFRLNVPLSIFQRQIFLKKGNVIIGLVIFNFFWCNVQPSIKIKSLP